jgi:hypothetical protein
VSKTPYFKTVYASAPKCAQCGRTFNRGEDRFTNDWGEVCRGCWDAGATLLKPTPDSAMRRQPSMQIGQASNKPPCKVPRNATLHGQIETVERCLRTAGRLEDARRFRELAYHRSAASGAEDLFARFVTIEDAYP